jgi:SAM-dependent methyltransferase
VSDPLVVHDPKRHWRVTSHAEAYERGRFSDLKGRVYRWAEERAIRRAMRALTRAGRTLDAACGTGRVTALLLREGLVPVGCDISRAMMSVGHRQLGDVPFLQSDVTRLPFGDDSFDAVTCIGLLMHLDADTRVAALAELARISRRLLLVQYGRVGALLRLTARVTGRQPGAVRFPVTERELRRDLRRSGLREVARHAVLPPLSSSLILLLAKA